MVRQRRTTPMTDEEFEDLALNDPKGKWELWYGEPRRKPPMTFRHNDVADLLAIRIAAQLDLRQFRVRIDKGHVRRPAESYFIPDIFVIPVSSFARLQGNDEQLEAYTDPMPLVIEVLSPSTRGYNLGEKLEEYKRRGDLEIWLVDPRLRVHTLTAWRRQPDGSYTETLYTRGTVTPVALPGMIIDLDALFE